MQFLSIIALLLCTSRQTGSNLVFLNLAMTLLRKRKKIIPVQTDASLAATNAIPLKTKAEARYA
ncbi:MAG: hypothetical protein ACOCQ4_01805, partial [bacterium]